jgi:hypothetical protein
MTPTAATPSPRMAVDWQLRESGPPAAETVRAALLQAANAAARAWQVTWLREGGLEAMADPDQRADVWR